MFWMKCILDFFSPERVCYSRSLNMRPFKAAWDCSAFKSLPSLFSFPSMLNACIGGRLFDSGTWLGGWKKSHRTAVAVFHSSPTPWFGAVSSHPIPWTCVGRPIPHTCCTDTFPCWLFVPAHLFAAGGAEAALSCDSQKSLSLDGVVCAFIDLVPGTTEAFPSPGCMISARALEQGLALAAGVFPVLVT